MKKLLGLLLIVTIAAGCGQQKQEAKKNKYEGVAAKTDFVEIGMKLLNDGKIPDAIKAFDLAIKKDPGNVDNYLVLAQIYMRLKNYTGAIDTLHAATKADAENGDVQYLLAMSKAVSGDKEGAKEAAQNSVNIFLKKRNEDKFKQSIALLKSLDVPSQ